MRRLTGKPPAEAGGSAFTAGAVLIARSPKRKFLEAYRERQEDLAREAITRFMRRHSDDQVEPSPRHTPA